MNMSEEFEPLKISVRADLSRQMWVQTFVGKNLEALNCSPKVRNQFRIAVDEIFSNIVLHSGLRKDDIVTVLMHTQEDPRSVSVTFIDDGIRFDPKSAVEPDLETSARNRQIGGLGIYLLKRIMDEVSYEYKDGQNILTIRKNL